MTAVNLIPAYRLRARRTRGRAAWWAMGCAAYALGLAIAYGVLAVNLEGRSDVVTGQIDRLEAQISQSRHTIAQTRQKLFASRANLRANLAVGRQPNFSVLLAVLAAHVGDEVILSKCSLTPRPPEGGSGSAAVGGKAGIGQHGPVGRYSVSVNGFAASQSAASDYVLRLEQTRLFERVSLLETTRQARQNRQVVGFRLQCLLGK